MIWIGYIVTGFVGLVLGIAAIGLMLPRAHTCARTATFATSPQVVWSALTNLDAQVTWRRGLERILHVSPTQFSEYGRQGVITFEIVENRPPSLRITRIADPRLPFGGRWIYELVQEGEGTRLTITEDGFIKNPVFRFLSKTVFSTASTLDAFLTDLARHLGTTPNVAAAQPSQRVHPAV